jgi:hypothetical protein
MKKQGLVLTAAFVACFIVGTLSPGTPANGAILNSMMSFLPPGNTYYTQYMHDLDAESLIKGGTNTQLGVIEVGDTLEAVMLFNDINGSDMSLPNYELTAHVKLLVTAKTAAGNQTVIINGNPVLVPVFNFDFGPVNPDQNGNGDLVWLYEDTTPDFRAQGQPPVSVATAVANATNGNLIATLGLGTEASQQDDFWQALASPEAVGIFSQLNTSFPGASFQFGVSVTANPGNVNIAPDQTIDNLYGLPHDVVGSGQPFGSKNSSTPFDLLTRTDVNFTAVIPEASSIAIWGLLTGIGLAAFRRR